MTSFKIATWNVNSLRVRLSHVVDFLLKEKPDVLALQETKLIDEDFPVAAFQEINYHALFAGQRTYNGVALLSRQPLTLLHNEIPTLQDPQKRFLCAMAREICVVNLYVPNGESVDSEKYQYKLQWLKAVDQFLASTLKHTKKVIVLGDFNIAPDALDVHDPKRWEGHVLFSQSERKAFQAMLSLGFSDCFRALSPQEQAYSWWDYRLNAFKRRWGLRIDHILASHACLSTLSHCYIDQAPRALDRPSDHAPVVAVFR